MTPLFWTGVAFMVIWGLICSRYILRDKTITLVMMLPFVIHIFMIVEGLK